MRTARLFPNGGSQAVRLPAEFRFDAREVYIRRDAATGEVILSAKPPESAWADFFAFRDSLEIPADFMAERLASERPAGFLVPRDP